MLQVLEAFGLIVTECIFTLLIFTMHQLRLKLELINSNAEIEVKKVELRRRTNISFFVGVVLFIFYTAGVIFGVIQETKKINTNGVLTQACKTLTLIVLTFTYFFVMRALRREMAKFDQSNLKSECKIVRRQQYLLGIVSLVQTVTCLGITIFLAIAIIKT